MKKSTGEKIVVVADVLFGLSVFFMIFGAIDIFLSICMTLMQEDALSVFSISIVFLIAGLLFYVSSLFVRGYGEMAINSDYLCDQADEMVEGITKLVNAKTVTVKYCAACRTPQNVANKFCCNCGIPMDTTE